MSQVIEGSCFCGGVRFEVDGPLKEARCCHCSRCRKAFNGASSAYAEIAPGALSWIEGEALLTIYGDPSRHAKAFCRVCGLMLCGIVRGQVHGVALGMLDGDPPVTIERHIFVGSKASWDEIGGAAPQYEEGG